MAINQRIPTAGSKPMPELGTDAHVLNVHGLCRRFGVRDVVRSLDLTLVPGERVALRGPNGSGKTTVLRCIAGTLAPTSGEIRIGGHPAGSVEAKQLIGASLAQERSFYMRLSGHANLLFYARLRSEGKRQAESQLHALEEELQLSDIAATRLDRCSTGMVQQLAFARALLGRPALLLLDEPTRSLDKEATKRLWCAIERRPRLSVLIATQLDTDLSYCGRTIDLSPAPAGGSLT
jgi:ABC-2 type transport system ATP-binding protein